MRARLVTAVVAATLALGFCATAGTPPAGAATTQTIAAGTSAKNLPTETVWAGSQNPPYVCCWGSQGQFVTFSFSVGGGSTNLGLRYSAGNGVARRKIELDGSVWVANQTFAATASWSTWSTVTLNQPALAAGPHTLKVWFDTAAGSSQFINLDNLTVTELTVVPPPVPVNTVLPAISGVAQRGQSLSVSTGMWTNTPTLFGYAWNRCAQTCVPIGGAVTNSYVLGVGDVGSTITATVIASNGGGSSAPTTSTPTATVVASSGGVSQTIAAGTSAKNLPTETVWAGSQNPPYVCCWGSQGQFVTFSFSVGGGSTNLGLRYSAGNGVARRKIELDGSVWVANQTFAATASWSTWSTVTLNQPALAAGPHTLKVWFDTAAGSSQFINLDNLTVTELTVVPPPVPVNTVLPAISGVAQRGQSLSVSTGMWTNTPTLFGYAWNRCAQTCVPIGGAVTNSYVLGVGDVGSTITATVIASNGGGSSAPATTTPTATVTTPPVPVNTVLPAISGVAQQGQSLSVSTGMWTNNPTLFGYAWNRCAQTCVPIGGAVTSSYVLGVGDVGSTIAATVIASNAGGDGVAATSLPTSTVTTPPVPVNNTPPTISGTALQGQSLSVSTGMWTNTPTLFGYAWNRCAQTCVPIGGAVTSSYVLGVGDVGSTITATVIASNGGGDGVAATSPSTVTVVAFSVGGSQTIAAGTSATNLPTETVWAGSQNPPYVCCWGSQGQFVTFSFSVGGGSTNLALRYSAGNGVAHRKIELDGSVLLANQAFAATATWNTWSTLTLNQQALAAGPHTLKVWFDAAAGSDQFINLDNLTVTQVVVAPPPEGMVVSLGYVHGAAGLTPWSGSANTTFLGDSPQCCLTWGPDNGSPGYDAGVIQVTNTSESPAVVNSVTVDFGGASSPSHFDLWTGSSTPHLPQTLAPGAHLVLTMNAGFNFDTSDLSGESCYANSGVVPVVHVTMNGLQTDYVDSHQILNSNGTDSEFCPSAVSEQVPFSVVVPGTQPAAPPVNAFSPTVTVAGTTSAMGTPVVGRVVSGNGGAWNASPPPSLSQQWTKCDAAGNNCDAIPGAIDATYIPKPEDVGSTLRLSVTASNPSGSVAVSSMSTPVVQSGPPVAQLGHTLTGSSAQIVASPTELSWISTATISGTTNDFAFYARGSTNDQVFTPKIYSVVNGHTDTLLATGVPITIRRAIPGQWYVTGLSGLHLAAGTQYALALLPSGAFNATYIGAEEDNGQLSFFVDFTPT